MQWLRQWTAAAGIALGAAPAWALQVTQASPQGSVREAQQVVLQMDADAVRFGDPQAAAPATVQCSDEAAAKGSGRWNSAREWVWQFDRSVTAGTRCTVQLKKDFQSPAGQGWTKAGSYRFEVAGPALLQSWPDTYEAIDEQQVFVLQLNAPATRESLLQHVHCQAEGVGERIPVRWVEDAQRQTILGQLGKAKAAAQQPGQWVALACNRRLTAGSTLQLVYGAGVATLQGAVNRQAQTLEFQVREPFTAQLQCERERANAGCLPIRDVHLRFSAPVAREQAQSITLQGPQGALAPLLEEGDGAVQGVRFAAPLQPGARYELRVPANVQDDAGRPLHNASAFPMAVRMGEAPTLAKFAAAPFGVLERYAEGPQQPAMLPVTVRNVEGFTQPTDAAGAPQLLHLRLQEDAQIVHWWNLVQRYHESHVARKTARADLKASLPTPLDDDDRQYVASRTVSLLQGQSGVERMAMPQPQEGDPRPFEVVGIPLTTPGLHVLEIASPRLGAALLDERFGGQQAMYVRTAVLVTNLAVHLKLGAQGSAVWVTSLDKGQPVSGAVVQVLDCRGQVHAKGVAGDDGVLLLPDLEREAPRCDDHAGSHEWFVSARSQDDVAFVWSGWQRGIESWRFHLPTGWGSASSTVAHTVMDRTLVRAGEPVSMKHFVREETGQGLALPQRWPATVVITHVGSQQQYQQPLQWPTSGHGGRSATSQFAVPPAAKLGLYTVTLQWTGDDGESRSQQSGEFRVEAFRLPILQGQVQPQAKGPLVQPGALPVSVGLQYLNGGSAGGQAVQVSALLRERAVDFERWAGYSFSAPRAADDPARGSSDADEAATADNGRLLADKLALQLDAQGQGSVTLPEMPALKGPQELLLEASFADPNGEIQTLRSSHTVWPAAVVPAIRTGDWVSVSRTLRWQALAVDTQGQPQAGVPLTVQGVLHSTRTTRKRLVGGFYSYDNQDQRKDLGTLCSGKSDARGLLLCEASLTEAGEVELVVTAKDSQGRAAQAADSLWVTRQGELWFGGQDHDRMDLLPEQARYAPGDVAQLQVRMPFREATALVTVEREGVLHSEVVQLKGHDPTVQLKVQPGWGPNVFVSVLALRGRLYEVPWYSFFTWGYKTPRAWWQAFWYGGKDFVAPTAMVDLSKPAFRLGAAELRVDDRSQQLSVEVQADKPRYQVRDTARITIRATQADGQPAAGAEVALAAVDKALLELSPNSTWQLHDGLWKRRDWRVETATAQMEVVGRRHYGRKAAPAGGGGGRAPTRELLDTLLLWQPRVLLDAQGEAQVEVPLNDALTSFTVVAVADAGVQRFGTGSTDIRTTQDLQLISGLPPVVREGDQWQALLTVRNTTDQPMQVQLQPQAPGVELAAQQVELPPQSAREVRWDVTVPQTLGPRDSSPWRWTVEASDSRSGARDRVAVVQRVLPAVPLAVQQATLVQVSGQWQQPLQWPAAALPGQGGMRLVFSERLADPQQGVPGLRDWWAAYPYSCLEQSVGRAMGLSDAALWQRTMAQLPSYLDRDGLALYFPQQDGARSQGSDTLTAHLLATAHEMQQLDARFALPAAERARMESALVEFVTGRLERPHWSPQQDLEVRKLAALAALSRSAKVTPAMVESLRIAPTQWPTHALLDWLTVLQRTPTLPQRSEHLAEVWQQLRSRLSYQGTQVGFSTDAQDGWWWLMQSPDVNAARLLLATLGERDWDSERARLVTGLLARQQQGSWRTTTANTWAGLALRQFSRRYETEPVTGTSTAVLQAASQSVDWRAPAPQSDPSAPAAGTALPSGSPGLSAALDARTLFLPQGPQGGGDLRIEHRGAGKPWVAVQTLAAVPRTQPAQHGYRVHKTITPVQQAQAGRWQRGDIVRVQLQVDASADMTWVAVNDPVPTGATILGSGLGRDSAVATRAEAVADEGPSPAFVERGQDSYRAYWAHLPPGRVTVQYTLRLNNAGQFALPATRVEALYAPDMWGETPNAPWQVVSPSVDQK